MRGAERDLTIACRLIAGLRWLAAPRPGQIPLRPRPLTVHSFVHAPNPHGRARHEGYQLSQLLVSPDRAASAANALISLSDPAQLRSDEQPRKLRAHSAFTKSNGKHLTGSSASGSASERSGRCIFLENRT